MSITDVYIINHVYVLGKNIMYLRNIMYSYICIAGMYVVFSFTLQYNPPLVSYSAKITKDVLQKLTKFLACS